MARTDWAASADLKAALHGQAPRFGFFQAVRLLHLIARLEGREPEDMLRIRATLSMAFPENDLEEVTERPDGRIRLTANFMGLYGVSSPLPNFYTEDLIDQAGQDQHAGRDFLDIIHHVLYPLLYRAWARQRQVMQVLEEDNQSALARMMSFVGLGSRRVREELPHAEALVRHAPLFTQFPRSALGLQTLLADTLEGAPVEVQSCVRQRLRLPQDQRLTLGCGIGLGEGAVLGQEVDDRMGSIAVRVGPVSEGLFHQLLPYKPLHNKLRFLVRFYLMDPLRSTVELVLAAGEAETARLGGQQWGALGLDTWVFSGSYRQEVRARFALYR